MKGLTTVYLEDEADADEFDPNVCPDCGGDLDHDPDTGATWCPVVSCGWVDEDDEDDED